MPVKPKRGRVVGGAQAGLGLGPRPRVPDDPRTRFPGRRNNIPGGIVTFWSDDLNVEFDCLLNTDGGRVTGGGPQYDVSPRVLRAGVPQYTGWDPLRMSVSVLLEGWPDTPVQPWITHFDEFQVVIPRLYRPATVHVAGSVPYRNKAWLLDGAPSWDSDPSPIRNREGELVRQPMTVNLIEFVKEDLLDATIERSRRRGSGKGDHESQTEVKKGENDFGDVSKRVYGNRQRAVELARYNGRPAFAKLKPGQKIRLP